LNDKSAKIPLFAYICRWKFDILDHFINIWNSEIRLSKLSNSDWQYAYNRIKRWEEELAKLSEKDLHDFPILSKYSIDCIRAEMKEDLD